MSTKIHASTFEFYDSSNTVIARMVAQNNKLEFLDANNKKVALKGQKQNINQVTIGGGVVSINMKSSNNVLCSADVNLTSINLTNDQHVEGQSGYICITNSSTRNHSVTWSSNLGIKWVNGEELIVSNVSGATTTIFYYVASNVVLLSKLKFYI